MKVEDVIESLNLSKSIIVKLKSIGIETILDLWKCTRVYLKDKGFTDLEVAQIRIKLQLEGMDLNHKYYKV